ncbi:MAG: ABC transporter ATP-binding protein [Gemmatimonadales bacterium]
MMIRFDGVSFSYPGAGTPALRDLSISFAAGQVTWLFGKLGAGSSTLLLAAGGFAPILTGGKRTGSVRVGELDPGDIAHRAALAGRIGYVSAQPHLQLSGLAESVFDEVAFAPANLGWERDRIEAAVMHALARVGAGHLAQRVPNELSGGELQRVVLAAMLVLAPAVWLLDEPASALDPAARAGAYALFREEARRGAAVVIATEDADGVLEVADRIIVLEHGQVALDGAPAAVLASDGCWALGAGSTTVGELWRAATEHAPGMARGGVPLTLEGAAARVMRT